MIDREEADNALHFFRGRLLGVLIIIPAVILGFPPASHAQDRQTQTLTITETETQAQPLDEDTLRRQQWSLSVEEWSRYQQLMHGIRGSISPATLSPLEVLGTHARNDQERRRYAERWARLRHEDAERILAFQQAYTEAFNKLYPDELLIDPKRLPRKPSLAADLANSERILVFLKLTQCLDCDRLVQRLLQHPALTNQQLDLYFVDTQGQVDDDRIRRWAKTRGLDRQQIKQGRITLNHDHGQYYRLTRQWTGPIPQLFAIKGQSITAVTL